MPIATITSKGQLTIPKSVRDALHLRPGDKVAIRVADGKAELRPQKLSLTELLAALDRIRPTPAKAMTVEDMDEAIAGHLAAKHPVSGHKSTK